METTIKLFVFVFLLNFVNIAVKGFPYEDVEHDFFTLYPKKRDREYYVWDVNITNTHLKKVIPLFYSNYKSNDCMIYLPAAARVIVKGARTWNGGDKKADVEVKMVNCEKKRFFLRGESKSEPTRVFLLEDHKTADTEGEPLILEVVGSKPIPLQ